MTRLFFIPGPTLVGVDARLLIAVLAASLFVLMTLGARERQRQRALAQAALEAIEALGGGASGPKIQATAQRSLRRPIALCDVYRCMTRLEEAGLISFVKPDDSAVARESGITSFYWITERGRDRLGRRAAATLASVGNQPVAPAPAPTAGVTIDPDAAPRGVPAKPQATRSSPAPTKNIVETLLFALICYRLYVTFATRRATKQP
jgi:hypothetical protein